MKTDHLRPLTHTLSLRPHDLNVRMGLAHGEGLVREVARAQ